MPDEFLKETHLLKVAIYLQNILWYVHVVNTHFNQKKKMFLCSLHLVTWNHMNTDIYTKLFFTSERVHN